MLDLLLFSIYINDFFEGLSTNAKLVMDNISLVFVIHVMNFNQDLINKAQEVIFSRKTEKLPHPPIKQSIYQKHLDIVQDSKLTFENHLKTMTTKINITAGLLSKLQNLLPRTASTTIYKAFVRSHIDCGDILHDQAFNLSFYQKLVSIQYSASLPTAGALRGTSK